MAESTCADAGWKPRRAGKRDATGRGCKSRPGKSFSALRVRCLDAPEPSGHSLRALRRRWCAKNALAAMAVRCCIRDEGRPLGAGRQGQASNRLKLHRSRAGVVLCQEDAQASCCARDGGRPSGAALQEEASNCHELLRSKAAVVNVMVKRRGGDRVMYGSGRRAQANLR